MAFPPDFDKVSDIAGHFGTLFVGFVTGLVSSFATIKRAITRWLHEFSKPIEDRFAAAEKRLEKIEEAAHDHELRLVVLEVMVKDAGDREAKRLRRPRGPDGQASRDS